MSGSPCKIKHSKWIPAMFRLPFGVKSIKKTCTSMHTHACKYMHGTEILVQALENSFYWEIRKHVFNIHDMSKLYTACDSY